jgi:HPt (histidine-containing phosphotransfer) domain-containing protein
MWSEKNQFKICSKNHPVKGGFHLLGGFMEIPKSSQIKYIQRRLDEIEKLKSSLNEGNFETAQRVGHQLKGNAVTFGFDEFQQIGESLELAAQNQDLHSSLVLVEKIYFYANQKMNNFLKEGKER